MESRLGGGVDNSVVESRQGDVVETRGGGVEGRGGGVEGRGGGVERQGGGVERRVGGVAHAITIYPIGILFFCKEYAIFLSSYRSSFR